VWGGGKGGGGGGSGKRSESRGQETAGGREQRAEVRIGQKTEQPEQPSALGERSYRAGGTVSALSERNYRRSGVTGRLAWRVEIYESLPRPLFP